MAGQKWYGSNHENISKGLPRSILMLTLNEAETGIPLAYMSGNLERKKPLILAHIPVGTTNDVGVMFGYGKDIKKNLKLLLDGTIKGMDICVINGRPFVYVAGIGKFMQIPYNTPRKLKKKYGFKLAVDFDVYRDFDDMKRFAPFVDFFMIRGSEELLPRSTEGT